MSSRVIPAVLFAALALPALARADAVADLRATLDRLQATHPLTATVKVSSTTKDEDGKTSQAQLEIGVASGGDGLRIGFSPELLQHASREAAANAKNRDVPTPIEDLLGKLSPVNVQPMVDYAPVLRRQLDGVTLASQRDETLGGKPAHLLMFDVPLPVSAGKQMTIKQYTGQLKLWLGSDGVPVAVRNTMELKGRKLLISIEFGNTADYRLAVIGTRLVVLSRRTEETHSVFGKAGSSITEATLSALPARPGA